MKKKLIFLLIISLFIVNGSQAQNKKRAKKIALKGLVIDTENNPIKNASVFIDGKNCKKLSDEEGRFKLKIKPNVKTVMVFTIAQGATEIAYQGEEELTFVLKAVEGILENDLNATNIKASGFVNTSYIKAHKRNLTTKMSRNNKNMIKNADHYLTIYDMIQGESAGVTVSGSTIRIRGVGSLVMSTTPLFIVNGIPVSSIDYVSPSQVKSISILKGSSAALYGVRGANGVIVITLKTAIDD
jgi:TonB-dependent SusC/RagA subfamily outer membrane receptor